MMEENQITPLQAQPHHAWSSIWHVLLLVIVGTVSGFQGYILLEGYFRFSYRGGLTGAFVPFVVLFFVLVGSILVSLLLVATTRHIQRQVLLIRLGLMIGIVVVITAIFFGYFRITLADQLAGIRNDAQNDTKYQQASKIGDCASISIYGYWTNCIITKVSSDSDQQSCEAQAATHGFETKDCARAHAVTTQDGQYCAVYGSDALGSCGYDIINETYKKITVAKAADVCATMPEVSSKTFCNIILVRGKPQEQLALLRDKICAGIDQSLLRSDELGSYQSFCSS